MSYRPLAKPRGRVQPPRSQQPVSPATLHTLCHSIVQSRNVCPIIRSQTPCKPSHHVCQISILPGQRERAAAVNVRQTEERTLIHPERREQLNKIKAMATTWTAKAGRWAREAPGASAPVLGHLGDNKLNVAAAKERGEVTDFVPKLVNPIPDSFDSAKEWP